MSDPPRFRGLTTGGRMFYLIQGFFIEERAGLGIDHDPAEGAVAVIRKGRFRTMCAGIFWSDKDGDWHGRMQDHHGQSELSQVTITEDSLQFTKKYFHRNDDILYSFSKRMNGAWEGKYEGACSGTGASRCIMTKLEDDFLEFPEET